MLATHRGRGGRARPPRPRRARPTCSASTPRCRGPAPGRGRRRPRSRRGVRAASRTARHCRTRRGRRAATPRTAAARRRCRRSSARSGAVSASPRASSARRGCRWGTTRRRIRRTPNTTAAGDHDQRRRSPPRRRARSRPGTLPTSTCVGASSRATPKIAAWIDELRDRAVARRRPRVPTRGRRPASAGSAPAPRSPRRPAASRSRTPSPPGARPRAQNGDLVRHRPDERDRERHARRGARRRARAPTKPHVACCSVCQSSAGSPIFRKMMTTAARPPPAMTTVRNQLRDVGCRDRPRPVRTHGCSLAERQTSSAFLYIATDAGAAEAEVVLEGELRRRRPGGRRPCRAAAT